jgi:periplasmic protein TonB
MTLGPGSLVSAAIHTGAILLLLVFPFGVIAPAPRPATSVVPIPSLVAVLPTHPSHPGPPRPSVPSKARITAPRVIPAPLDVPESVLQSPEPVDAAPCSGCVLAFAPGAPDGAGNGSERSIGDETGVAGGPPAMVRVGTGVQAPRKLVHVDPSYPELARRAGVQGIVRLECTIDPSGDVVDVVVKSGHPLLTAAAAEAVRQWRYTATRLNGAPVAVLMSVTVRFSLPR